MSEEKEQIQKDIKLYSSLEAVERSEGGQILIKGLKKDVASAIDEISLKYRTLPDIELRAAAARLSERINLLRTLTRATKNKKFAVKELESLQEEEEPL